MIKVSRKLMNSDDYFVNIQRQRVFIPAFIYDVI